MPTPEAAKKSTRTGKSAGGRPPKTDAERQLKGVTVRLTLERHAELQAYAAEGGRTLAHVVRAVMNSELPALTPAQEGYLRQLAGMANNLNQLAKKAHQEGFVGIGLQVQEQALRISELLDNFNKQHG